jgi:uncharacterized protein with FMN-binding domain
MKRAPIVLTATAAGLAAALGFSPHSRAPTATGVSTTPSTSSSSSSGSSTTTATGEAIPNQYGNVQLKVTISGGKITQIEPVQLPSGDSKSSQISSYAEPQLRQSALAKQSENIDVVSGATYTSDGYRTALQSALDIAGFHASARSQEGLSSLGGSTQPRRAS